MGFDLRQGYGCLQVPYRLLLLFDITLLTLDLPALLHYLSRQFFQLVSQKYDQDKIEEELGDLLFSVVNVARFAGVDAERALYRSTDKFAKRFRAVEGLAKERGIDMKSAPTSLIDSLWEEVK